MPTGTLMSSLTQADIDVIQLVGHDAVQNIVALVVEAVLWST